MNNEKYIDKEWLTSDEAADLLCLSKSRLYHIKNKLTHRKGNTRQARLLFKRDCLIEDYMRI